MILEKKALTLKVLTEHPTTRGDGHGNFLNIVAFMIYGNSQPDFNEFSPESWTRARRKVLSEHPELDMRTSRTKEFEAQVKSEVA